MSNNGQQKLAASLESMGLRRGFLLSRTEGNSSGSGIGVSATGRHEPFSTTMSSAMLLQTLATENKEPKAATYTGDKESRSSRTDHHAPPPPPSPARQLTPGATPFEEGISAGNLSWGAHFGHFGSSEWFSPGETAFGQELRKRESAGIGLKAESPSGPLSPHPFLSSPSVVSVPSYPNSPKRPPSSSAQPSQPSFPASFTARPPQRSTLSLDSEIPPGAVRLCDKSSGEAQFFPVMGGVGLIGGL